MSRQRKDVALRAADKAANASERAAEQTSPRRRLSIPYRGLCAGDFFDQFVGRAIRMALLEKAKNVTDGKSRDTGAMPTDAAIRATRSIFSIRL